VIAYTADPAAGAAAMARLAAAGYSEAGLCERLGMEDLADFQMKALPIYRAERLCARDPLDLAIELFMLEAELPKADLDRLFEPADQAALERAGILTRAGGSVRAEASLYPVGRTLVFSDHAWPQLAGGRADVPYDQVMYVGTDSRWLARATLRGPVAAALDLCCGSGVQAMLAASHADRVSAVDLNPRAVRCTAFNARISGLAHLEALQGDLYGPVGDRRFGLITANPPFVPAPAQEVGYRDGGPSGEEVQRRIVAGLPGHLAPGGTAQLVTELGERDGEPLERRLRQWLDGAPMAIHVLRLRSHSAQTYALGHADGADEAALLDSVERWAANLREQGYRRVVSVLLAFQWSDPAWSRVDQAQPPRRAAGAELEAIFQAERLARDPGLEARLRRGRVGRTGPLALLDASCLGAPATPTAQARLAGQALAMDHPLEPLERDLLGCLEQPTATAALLAAAARAGAGEAAVLAALTALVRKGLIRPLA